jgi:hypothetical protein
MEHEGYLDPDTTAWVQDKANRDYGRDFGRAAAAIIEGARAREMRPDDPWAELDTQRRLSDHARHGRR